MPAKRGWGFPLIACFAICAQTLAQGQASIPKLPIFQTSSFLLGRIDLAAINPDAIDRLVANQINSSKLEPAQRDELLNRYRTGVVQLVNFRQGMIDAGAPVIYFTTPDWPPNDPIFFVPVGPKGDAAVVAKLMNSGRVNGPTPPSRETARGNPMVAVNAEQGVICCRAQIYDRLKAEQAAAPHLIFALSNAPAGALQLVVAPSEAISTALETSRPQIPPPIDMPMTTLTKTFATAVLTVQSPPNPSALLKIQCMDADAASQLKILMDRAVQFVGMQAQANMKIDPALLVKALTPNVQKDELSISIDAATMKAIAFDAAPAMVASLQRANETALMVRSASNIRHLLVQALMYSVSHNQAYPDSFDDFSQTRDFSPQLLQNPRIPNKQLGYKYHKPAAGSRATPDTIVVYEDLDALPAGTRIINIGYADGHVTAQPRATIEPVLRGLEKDVAR